MNTIQDMEYHIELTSIRNFANELIVKNIIPIDRNVIFNDLKKAVISSNVKPFLLKTEIAGNSYYNKYERLEREFIETTIPDFFSYVGDFYDLDEVCNFSRNNINENIFQRLFEIKLMELDRGKGIFREFLDFQLYDNYYGNKEGFGIFLLKILAKDGNSYLSPAIASEIRQWIQKNKLTDLVNIFSSIKDDQIIDDDETNNDPFEDYLKIKKNLEIKGNMTIEEIRHYFSFLYKEILDKRKPTLYRPFLTEDEVTQIFAKGLLIPETPLEKKFKLKTELRFPKKIVDFAIHKFITLNSITKRDKADYFLFFGSYIEDYQEALNSKESLTIICSNMTGKRSTRDKIKWEEYIPAKYIL